MATVYHLEDLHGFKYRSLYGKLLFPSLCGRVDICKHLNILGQVMTRPASIHFDAFRELATHLVRTRFDGPIYWRRHPTGRSDLPDGNFQTRPPPPEDASKSPWSFDGLMSLHLKTEQFDGPTDDIDAHMEYLKDIIEQMVSYSDASFADDLRTRKSTTSSIHMLWGGLLDYLCQLQSTLACSTTESELAANTTTGKRILWFRNIIKGMGIIFSQPCMLYVDNEAAEKVENGNGTTRRLRHVDVNLFAMQEWTDTKQIQTGPVPSYYNLADASTKINTQPIYTRLLLRIFGYHGPQVHKRTVQYFQKKAKDLTSH